MLAGLLRAERQLNSPEMGMRLKTGEEKNWTQLKHV